MGNTMNRSTGASASANGNANLCGFRIRRLRVVNVVMVGMFVTQLIHMVRFHAQYALDFVTDETAGPLTIRPLLRPQAQAQTQSQAQTLEGRIATIRRKTPHNRSLAPTNPDGYFNGVPIVQSPVDSKDNMFHSTVHCVGDNFDLETSWKHRTCHFRNLCFDVKSNEYVLVRSEAQKNLQTKFQHSTLLTAAASSTWVVPVPSSNSSSTTASSYHTQVAIGGINPKWAHDQPRIKWFPRTIEELVLQHDREANRTILFQLPSDVTLVPFHSFAGFNPGHLVWDDLLPLYTLLTTFGLLHTTKPLYIRHIIEPTLWASCDKQLTRCYQMMNKFWPLMGFPSSSSSYVEQFTTQKDTNLTLFNNHNNNNNDPSSNSPQILVCANHGAAGLGMATDHGTKLHGWDPKDYKYGHNANRGSQLKAFRDFLLTNIQLSTDSLADQREQYQRDQAEALRIHATTTTTQQQQQPQKNTSVGGDGDQVEPLPPTLPQPPPPTPFKTTILFSIKSSNQGRRVVKDFDAHIRHLRDAGLDTKYGPLDIQQVQLSAMSLQEQASLVSRTSIFLTVCGGGTVTAVLLPEGSSLIVFFNPTEGHGKTPARLDWDFFGHAPWIRTHWLPRFRPNEVQQPDFEAFVALMDQELDHVTRHLHR